MLLLGLMWIGQAVGVAEAPYTPGVASGILLHERLPVSVRVVLWAGTGLLACFYGFRSRERRDTVGFVAAVVMPLERAFSFLVAYLLHLAYRFEWTMSMGYERGLVGASVWLAVAAAVMVVAGWPEGSTTRPADVDKAGEQ